MIKKFLLGLIVLIILVASGEFAATWLSVRKLEKVSDPKSFALNFDTSGKAQAELEIGGFEGRTIISPFFPYSKLKTEALRSSFPRIITQNGKTIEDLTERGVYINKDPFWNIFWVEITPEAQAYARTQFYGPYKIE